MNNYEFNSHIHLKVRLHEKKKNCYFFFTNYSMVLKSADRITGNNNTQRI